MKKGNHLVKKQVTFDKKTMSERVGDPVKREVRCQGNAAQFQPCRFDRYVYGNILFKQN